MKYYKGTIIKSLLIIILIYMFTFKVNAASLYNTTIVNEFPSKLQHVFLGTYGNGLISYNGVNLYYKYTDKQNAALLCSSFKKNNSDKNGAYAKKECTPINDGWSKDNAVASGVASIILEASGGKGKKLSEAKYHSAELAINTYLKSTKKYENSFMRDFSQINEVKELSGVATDAQNAYKQFDKKDKLSVSLGNFKCTGVGTSSGQCTANLKVSAGVEEKYDKDTNYQSKINYSYKFYINKNDGNGYKELTDNYSYSNGKLKINNIDFQNSESFNWSVKAKFTGTRTYYTAKNYNCGSDNQTVVPNLLKKNVQTKKGTSVSNIQYDKVNNVVMLDCKVTAHKVAASNQEPLGRVSSDDIDTYAMISFDIADGNGNIIQNGHINNLALDARDAVLSDADSINDEALDIGNMGCLVTGNTSGDTFTIKNIVETQVPVGYKAVKNIPNIEYNGEPVDFYLENKPDTSVIIKKIDGDTNQILEGATISIYKGSELVKWNYVDLNGDIVSTPVEDSNGNILAEVDKNGSNTSWISTKKTLKLMGLDYDISYTFKEEKAPQGYIINNPASVVELKNDSDNRNKTVEFKDYKSAVTISKQDITNSKEVPGAHLRIIDGQENVYAEWISTDTPKIIDMLSDETYYLEETIAPEGYELSTTRMEFTVKNGKAISNVVMYNTPTKVTIANTLLNKKIITYILGGILILGGAGVLGYELKKRKVFSK